MKDNHPLIVQTRNNLQKLQKSNIITSKLDDEEECAFFYLENCGKLVDFFQTVAFDLALLIFFAMSKMHFSFLV